MATAAQRRTAQRRTARELQAGTYQRSEAGIAHQRELARKSGTPAGGTMGKAGWRHSAHTTLNAAVTHAGNLPWNARVVISARGRTTGQSGAAGEVGWLALHPAADPAWYRNPRNQDALARSARSLFETTPSAYLVSWVLA